MKQVKKLEELYSVKSSNISRIGYDSGDAYVEFKNGNIYKYPEVQRQVVDQLVKSESIGKAFSQTLKNAEKYEKLENITLVNSLSNVEEALNLLENLILRLNAYDAIQANAYQGWQIEKDLKKAINLLRNQDGNV